MAAVAVARRAPATRRGHATRRRRAAPAPQRAAIAMRELPDSGLVLRLTHGRAWIPLLGLLLAGIVALNVASLGYSSSAGRLERSSEELESANSELRAELARRLSSPRVQSAAKRLGLVVPQPGDISYVRLGDQDARRAAQQLADATPLPAGPSFVPTSTVVSVPTTAPATPAPTATALAQPAEPPAVPPPPAGGIGAPR